MLIEMPLLHAHPYPMQLSPETVPQEHRRVCANVSNVTLIFGGKQLLLHALFEGPITAAKVSRQQ